MPLATKSATRRRVRTFLLPALMAAAVAACLLGPAPLPAQTSSTRVAPVFVHRAMAPVPPGAQFQSDGRLDPEAATQAYLNTLSAEKRHDSDKYFEGGYWLILWDAVYGIAVLLLLLYSGVSARIRDFMVARTGRLWLQTAVYFVLFMLLLTILTLPMNWYEGFYRSH